MVRELGEAEEERLTLAFVPRISDARDPAEFEILVSAAASVANHLVASGARFRFLSDAIELSPASGREHERAILTYLATVEPVDACSPELLAALDASVERGDRIVLVAFDDTAPRVAEVRVVEPKELLARA